MVRIHFPPAGSPLRNRLLSPKPRARAKICKGPNARRCACAEHAAAAKSRKTQPLTAGEGMRRHETPVMRAGKSTLWPLRSVSTKDDAVTLANVDTAWEAYWP